MKYNLVNNDGTPSSVTVFFSDNAIPRVATKDHKNFNALIEALRNGAPEEEVRKLIDVASIAASKFEPLSERVSISNGMVYFDGDPMDDTLAQLIVAFVTEGLEDFKPLVLFMEKLMQNPNAHSREQLFNWTRKWKFSIDADGDLIGYKGVDRKTGVKEDIFVSVSSGRAIVNGTLHTGKIPTTPGVVVEMPRGQVNHNPSQGCSTGLHVGNWAYARGFASTVLRVKVNPRDVVSVPTDCNEQKMRVCRYRILGPVTAEDESTFFVDKAIKTLCLAAVDPAGVAAAEVEERAEKVEERTGKTVPAKVKEKIVKKVTKATKAAKLPKFYEDFTKKDFATRPFNELRWLAKEWGVKAGPRPTADVLAAELAKHAAKLRRSNAKAPTKKARSQTKVKA